MLAWYDPSYAQQVAAQQVFRYAATRLDDSAGNQTQTMKDLYEP